MVKSLILSSPLMHLCFIYHLISLVVCSMFISYLPISLVVSYVHILVQGVINLILDQLNVFFLGILVLKRDIDATHLLFVVFSLVMMLSLMSLNPISLLRLVVIVLSLVSLDYRLCLLLHFLLKNHSRCIIETSNKDFFPT